MKFPYELSKERLSLLSPEDREIYEYEHSGLCTELKQITEGSKKVIRNDEGKIVPDTCPKCGGEVVVQIKGEPIYVCGNCGEYFGTVPFTLHEAINNAVNNDYIDEEDLTLEDIQDFELDDDYSEEEKQQIKSMLDEMLFESEFDGLFDKELIEEVGEEEYQNIKKQIFEYIENDPELKPLYEAEGVAADFWMKGVKIPGLGWLGKLAGGLLTGLLGVVAWLLMKGKDRLALKKLKQYMNKLVELTDSGVNKKKPWYSFLIPTKKGKRNNGDYDKACFRTMQETAERNMACLFSKAVHDLGFLTPGSNNFNRVVSEMRPQRGSGLSVFKDIATNMATKTEGIYQEGGEQKLIPFKQDETIFDNIYLPPIPTNYSMLMSNIDYPTKANENPNGSLFMKPTQEILQAQGSDLGTANFNKDTNFDNIIKYTKNEVEESLLRNTALRALLEVEGEDGLDKSDSVSLGSLVSDDMDGDILGSNLKQETKKREDTKVTTFKGNLIDAIDNYIMQSVSRIENLIRSVCQENANITEFTKTIHTLIDSADGNSEKFMKKHNEILKTIMDSDWLKERNKIQNHNQVSKEATKILSWITNDNFCKKIRLQKKNEFIEKISSIITDIDEDNTSLKNLISNYTGNTNFEDLRKEAQKEKIGQYKDYNESLKIDYKYIPLLEDEQIKNKEEILTNLVETQKKSYHSFRNELSSKIDSIVSQSDPSQWYIIKNTRDRMNKLKEAADKEITAKIEIICRTATSANANIGSKFKAAISQHPMRAESLKGIWTRYSDDLNDRIESRIRSIYGANGNVTIFNTVKDFLRMTYPNLIAVMLYYRQYFYLVKLYTSENPIEEKSAKQLQKEQANDNLEWLKAELMIAETQK